MKSLNVWNCRVLSVKMILKKFWRRDRRLGMNSIYHFICCSFWKFDPAKFVFLLPADFFLRTASALLILTNSQQRIGVCGFFKKWAMEKVCSAMEMLRRSIRHSITKDGDYLPIFLPNLFSKFFFITFQTENSETKLNQLIGSR